MGSSGGSKTQTTKSEPWEEQKPYLEYGFEQALGQYQSDKPNYFPNSTVVGFSPESETAMQATAQRAASGSPLNAAASQQMQSTINGDYLAAQQLDPYFDQARRSVDSQFANSGRYGSGLHKTALAETFGNIAANQYGNERDRQMQASQFAPTLAQQDYADMQALSGVGQQREAMAGNILGDQMDRFNFEQGIDQAKLADYMQLVQGNYGGTNVERASGGGGNTFGKVLGTAATIAPYLLAGSDKRIKRDIKQIGEHKGFPLYEFKYVWDDVKHIGVMAQDVIKTMPEAVIETLIGYYMVDYSKVWGKG